MCPSPELVRALAAGTLPASEAEPIRAHAATCEPCRRILASAAPPTEAPADLPAPEPGANAADGASEGEDAEDLLKRGDSVGRYDILQHLASGGMGAIYTAYDPQLDRRVALKVLARPSDVAPGGVDRLQLRLQREAQAMARLTHPNVVAVHDVGTFGGRVFVAMEFVDGLTLRSWLELRRRSWREIRDIFVQAGRGLAAAHAVGLVHRDFKPDNVLVGGDDRARVADFGLARPASEASADRDARDPTATARLLDTRLTLAGAVVGTPRYMAPEQIQALPEDARTDQFSFAVALYEALFGVRAFKPRMLEERLQAIQAGELTPPAPGHGVPDWLAAAVRRALSADPARRHQSMDALLEALQQDARKARLGARSLAAAGVLLAALAGTALWLRPDLRCKGAERNLQGVWDADRRAAARAAFAAAAPGAGPPAFDQAAAVLDAYAADWAAMREEACAATHLRKEQPEAVLALRSRCLDLRLRELQKLTALFAGAGPKLVDRALDAVHGLSPVRSCGDVSSLTDLTPPPESPEARKQIEALGEQLAEASALRLAGDYAQALDKASGAVQVARRLRYRPAEAEALFQRGLLEERLDRWGEATATQRDAVHAADAARMDLLRAQAASRLVFLSAMSDAFAAGREWAAVASSALERQGGPSEREGDLLVNLGTLELSEGRLEEAAATYERARDLLASGLGRDHPQVLAAATNLAAAYNSLGRFPEAAPLAAATVAAHQRARGRDHPVLITPLRSLAVARSGAGERASAHQSIDEALRIARARLGSEHLRVADCLDIKATIYQDEGRFQDSLALYRASLEMKRKLLSPRDPGLSYSHDGIGQSLLGMGRPEEAAAALQEALSLRGVSPGDRADTQFGLARALWQMGKDRRAAALRHGAQALAGYQQARRPDRARTVEAWLATRR